MCGFVGVVACGDRPVSVSERDVVAMRDRLTRRGPDDAGVWLGPHAAFGHRRLAVLDPTTAGRQPMATDNGRFVLVYNGELYNDEELRRELRAHGVRFQTSCDTETLLRALEAWGTGAIPRLRGMYAFAWYDTLERRVLLVRDPLGIKPLCWWLGPVGGGLELVFASEVTGVLAHPSVPARPDWVTVSAYLTTIRTTLEDRTLFENVRTLRPGEVVELDLGGDEPRAKASIVTLSPPERRGDAGEATRAAVEDAVRAHLRSDVPLCTLLSGGLDSSACALIASRERSDLRSYCAGASEDEAPVGGVAQSEDFVFARLVSERLGTRHAEAVVSRELFGERWRWMVGELGVPLSTPNETAIYEVASRLRADGCVVTLSGEGADELFGGYDAPLRMAAAHVASGDEDPGVFQLLAAQWTALEQKPAVLSPGAWRACGGDGELVASYRAAFERVRTGADPLSDHLRFHRLVNLEGLLRRLDTATMLASVEGRTPIADVRVAALAESLPMRDRFVIAGDGSARTKIALRAAFAGDLPREVVERPKASFPLPFQRWVGDQVGVLRESAFAREAFTPEAIETVCADAEASWTLAWPMVNLAIWGRRWWG